MVGSLFLIGCHEITKKTIFELRFPASLVNDKLLSTGLMLGSRQGERKKDLKVGHYPSSPWMRSHATGYKVGLVAPLRG